MFAAALAWRLILLARLVRTPLLDALEADAATYWAWASLLRTHGWAGSNPFFLAPLYPYALALMRSFVGDSIIHVLVVQALVGALAAPILADAARRLTTQSVGLLTGVVAAGYGMSALYGLLVLSECVLFTLGAALVWLLAAWPWQKRVATGAIIAGSLIGVMALGRATALLLVLPLAVLLFECLPVKRVARALGVTLAMIAILAAPVAIRHFVILHEWIPYTYSFGYNAYVGNGLRANGTFVPMNPVDRPTEAVVEGGVRGDGRDLIRLRIGHQPGPSESSAYWLREALHAVASQPIRASRLMAFKAGLLLNHHEVPQIEDPAAYRMILGPLGLPLVGTFGWVGAFGLAGGLIAIRRGPRERALALYVLCLVLATSAFFVTARYRVHLVPALLPLAGVTVASLWRRFRAPSVGGVGGVALVLALATIVVALPLLPSDHAHDEWSAAKTLGDAWLRHSEPKLALAQFDRAVEIDRSGQMRNADTPIAREVRASVFQSRGEALLGLGEFRRARASFEEANQFSPNDPDVLGALGQLYALDGNVLGAKTCFQRIGVGPDEGARALVELAAAQDRAGDGHGVESSLRAAVALDPRAEAAWVGLVRLLAETGRSDSALAVLDRAKAQDLDSAVYAAHRVLIASLANRKMEARAWRMRISNGVALSDQRVRSTLELARAEDR